MDKRLTIEDVQRHLWQPKTERESDMRFSALSFFFINQFVPDPLSILLRPFQFFRKFAEIFANEWSSAVSTPPAMPAHLDKRHWGRQNYFKPKRQYLVLAASGASDQEVWGAYGCNFSWRFQWHHRQLCPTSAAGDIRDLSPSTFSYRWQLPTSKASLFLSPAINLSPAITENPCQGLFAGVNDTGDKFIGGVVDTGEQLIAGVVDRWWTFIRVYLREFSKKFEMAPMEYLWARGTMIHKKTWSRKSRVRLPF